MNPAALRKLLTEAVVIAALIVVLCVGGPLLGWWLS